MNPWLGNAINRYFYFAMSLVIAMIVIAGFGHTIGPRLLHSPVPRPLILHIHVAIFCAWVIFFMLQTALVGWRNVWLHRRLGVFGALLGCAIPLVGTATAIVIDRAEGHHGDGAAAFLAVSLYDMAAFAITFGLAVSWRKKTERHRRLMLIATCGLMSAAIARIIAGAVPFEWIYAGVDGLILLGALRDLLIMRRVHLVYLVALPLLVFGQGVAICLALARPFFWLHVAHQIIG
ncbi:hypothetical protein [Rhodanobacter sp. L36]|uniref:hypothetical protein n=1 Tax=Rhodanobacter sp. L36 TaxID=1747221 RepID=UPI00131BB32A|nr:hypothetical protein [Rhodanobacter sp. L36]